MHCATFQSKLASAPFFSRFLLSALSISLNDLSAVGGSRRFNIASTSSEIKESWANESVTAASGPQ